MSSGLYSSVLFFHALIAFQCIYGFSARKMTEQHWNFVQYREQQSTKNINLPNYAKDVDEKRVNSEGDQSKRLEKHTQENPSVHMDNKDLAVNVFFTVSDLKFGKKIPIYFPIKEPSIRPPLLSREEADSIPFSSSRLPYLLALFSFSKDSPQAKAMEDTIKHCEFVPVEGETKFCATSLESMLDCARSIFGFNTPFKVLSTNHLTESTSILQNYTILEEPKVISAPKIVACHTLPYPYAVFYCHSQKSDNKLFKVSLVGDNGGRVDAFAVCHMDTSKWGPNHVAFQVLKTHPGSSPVCHFFPEDNLVWVASSVF